MAGYNGLRESVKSANFAIILLLLNKDTTDSDRMSTKQVKRPLPFEYWAQK